MTISDEHRWSLNRAGIGSNYHDRSLRDGFGEEGLQLDLWARENYKRVKEGHSVLMTGIRSRELMMMLARAFHLNKLGVYVTPLVRIGSVLFDNAIKDQVHENDILVILGFQQEGECPLKTNLIYETEHLINDRSDRGKTTFLTIPLGDQESAFDLEAWENWWWSAELVDTLLDRFEILDMSSRVRL